MRLFIVNPVSGNGRGLEVWAYVENELRRTKEPYQVAFTEGNRTEQTRLGKWIRENRPQAVVAIGGDGTVHEVGNRLIGTHIPLGHIPAGTGNDFALAHRIPFDPLYALKRILQHRVRRVDTARFGRRNMISFMGFGFDGLVAEKVNQSSWNKWLSRLTYTWGAIQVLRSFEPTQLTLTIDGKTYAYDQVWLIAITNTPNYAGGMEICPQAQMDDGQLDICCVRNLTKSQFLRVFPSVYRGRHIHHPSVHLHRGREITIQTDHPITSHVDGEIIDELPQQVSVSPQSLFVL